MTVGIYRLFNKVTGRSYVGKSTNIEKRIKNHFSHIRSPYGSYTHRKMREDAELYGIDSFDYEVLEECEPEQLDDREGYWAYQFKVLDPEKGYNTDEIKSYHHHAMQDPVYRAEWEREQEQTLYQTYLSFVEGKRSNNPADPEVLFRFMFEWDVFRTKRFRKDMRLIERFLQDDGYSSPLKYDVLDQIPALAEEYRRQEEVLRQIRENIRRKLRESVGLNSEE